MLFEQWIFKGVKCSKCQLLHVIFEFFKEEIQLNFLRGIITRCSGTPPYGHHVITVASSLLEQKFSQWSYYFKRPYNVSTLLINMGRFLWPMGDWFYWALLYNISKSAWQLYTCTCIKEIKNTSECIVECKHAGIFKKCTSRVK